MTRLTIAAVILILTLTLTLAPVRAQGPPEGTAPAPRRVWDYRTDREIRASRGLAQAPG